MAPTVQAAPSPGLRTQPKQDLEQLYDDPETLGKANDAAKIVLRNWWDSDQRFVNPMRDKVADWYNLYRNYIEIPEDSIRSNLHVPLAHAHVESQLPRLVAHQPRTDIYARAKGSPEAEQVAAMLRAINYEQWTSMEMPLHTILWSKSSLYQGLSYVKLGHRHLEGTRMVRRSAMSQAENQEQGMLLSLARGLMDRVRQLPISEEERQDRISSFIEKSGVILESGPFVDCVDFDKIFPKADATSVEGSPWIIHEYRESVSNLENLMFDGRKLYKESVVREINARVRGNNPLHKHHGYGQSLRTRRLMTFGPEMDVDADPTQREVTLLERWTDDKVTTICAEFPDLEPLRHERNVFGFKPVESFAPTPLPNELMGISTCETLYALNLGLDTMLNTELDHLLSSVHPMWFVLSTARSNPNDWIRRPDGNILVDEMGEIQPVPTQPLDFNFPRSASHLREWAKEGTGVTDTFQGLNRRSGTNTATEAGLLAQSSASRVGLMIQLLSIALTRLTKKVTRINTLFWDEERAVRIAGSEIEVPDNVKIDQFIDPELIHRHSGLDWLVTVDVGVNEPETRQLRAQRATQGIMATSQIPTEQWANPVMQGLLMELLDGVGVRFPHERVRQMAELGRQLMAQQGPGTLGVGAGEGGGAAPTPNAQNAVIPADEIAAVLGAEQGGQV